MWIFTIVISFLIPVMMILYGLYFTRANLPEINALFGYRTSRSMKNNDTWIFSNRLMGEYWLKIGSYVSILTVVLFALLVMTHADLSEDDLGVVLSIIVFGQIIFMLVPIYFVEKALKDHFDEDGNRIR